jgi:predicted acetyltransferase
MNSVRSLAVTRAVNSERQLLQQMLELYQHDLSDIWDQDLDVRGEFGYSIERFWQDPNCAAYIFWIEQFFVMKKYRKRGMGSAAARIIFNTHVGQWQVGQMTDNFIAQSFWRSVIGKYTLNHYNEVQITSGWWQGIVQSFTSAPE